MSEPLSQSEARKRGLRGSNIRCNLCGSYGAEWIQTDEAGKEARPNWGSLALCPEHAHEWRMEMDRHRAAKRRLQQINFNQDIPKQSPRYMVD